MLAELLCLRELQAEQERALQEGDAEAVARLCDRGRDLIAAVPTDVRGLDEAQRERARSLAGEVIAAQGALELLAAQVQRAVATELRGMAPGREALTGYRPAMRDTARLVDRAR